MSYYDKFATAFSKIPLMNELIDSSTFQTQITKFKQADVIMSSWLKGFLLKIFENTRLYEGETTNLATIGANAMSYILVIMVVVMTMFMVLNIVAGRLVKKYVKIKQQDNFKSKFGGFVFGTLTGLVYVIIYMAIISAAPIGADNTTIPDAIKRTVILEKPFEFSQTITIDYFATKIDWTSQNQNFTGLSDVMLTTYKSQTEDAEYRAEVEIFFDNRIRERIYDQLNNVVMSNQCYYIYANGKLWEYKYDENSNFVLVATRKLSKKSKALVYETEFEYAGETIKYKQVLKPSA